MEEEENTFPTSLWLLVVVVPHVFPIFHSLISLLGHRAGGTPSV